MENGRSGRGGLDRRPRRSAVLRAALGAACAFGLLTSSPAGATIIHATSATFSGGIDALGNIGNTTTLLSFTTANGTESNLSGAVSVVSVTGGTDLNRNLWGNAGSEINGAASLTGLDVGHGAANINIANIFFGQTITGNPGDGNDLFIVDVGSQDNVTTVRPIDALGNVIGDFSLTLLAASWIPLPTTTANFDAKINQTAGSPPNSGTGLNNLFVRILAFDLEDFSGTGSLTGLAGIQIDGDRTLDPMVIGFVPEPGTSLLLAAGLLGLARIRRRS